MNTLGFKEYEELLTEFVLNAMAPLNSLEISDAHLCRLVFSHVTEVAEASKQFLGAGFHIIYYIVS